MAGRSSDENERRRKLRQAIEEGRSQGAGIGGQRAPEFAEDHELSMVHGGTSERRVAPLAVEILARERSKPSWPQYLDDASWAFALASWARAEAVCELLTEFLSTLDIRSALSDVITTVETEEQTGRATKRRSATRRVASALEMLRKYESIASNHRHRLGLDPLGRARLGKDISATTNVDLAQYWQTDDD